MLTLLKSIGLFILLVLVILIVWFKDTLHTWRDDWRYASKVNPHPTVFITYKGYIDPSLNHLVKLVIVTEYDTQNPKCEKEINWLEGISVSRQRLHYTYVEPDERGYFKYKVPLDKYLPGQCDWQAVAVTYTDINTEDPGNDSISLINFSSKKQKYHRKEKQIFQKVNNLCGSKSCEYMKNPIWVMPGNTVPNYIRQTFELNYYRENNDNL